VTFDSPDKNECLVRRLPEAFGAQGPRGSTKRAAYELTLNLEKNKRKVFDKRSSVKSTFLIVDVL